MTHLRARKSSWMLVVFFNYVGKTD